MAINKNLWVADLAANLFETNDWYRIGRNWNQYLSGATVTIPQGGEPTLPVAEGALTPFSATTLSFGYKTFNNTGIFAPARTVSVKDSDEASFDTRSAVMNGIVGELKQAVSQQIAYGWSPNVTATESITDTSGTTSRLNQYGEMVDAMTFNDIMSAIAKMSKYNPNMNYNDLYIIVDSFLFSDIVAMGTQFVGANSLVTSSAVSGFVGEIAGLKVIRRNLGIPYTAGKAAKAAVDYSNSYGATTLSAALIVEGSKVGFALGTPENGEIDLQIMENAANVFKPIMQAYTRVGATSFYDEKTISSGVLAVPGVCAIIETAS